MKKTTQLKQLLQSKKAVLAPGAYDALSARIIEKVGFQVIQCTGYGIAASVLGTPDIGLLSMDEMLCATRNICNAVDIPCMGDCDTGFGNVINVYWTIQRFEQAGCAGINLEDQVLPKRCGHMDGKQVIPMEEMEQKIRAAVKARKDPDFVINARTDAIAVYGVDEALKRAKAYIAAGADMIFVEAPREKEDVKRIVDTVTKEYGGLISVNLVDGGGKTPLIPVEELRSWGVSRVSVPVAPVFAAAKGVDNAMTYCFQEQAAPSMNHPEALYTFKEFTELVRLPFYRSLEQI